MTWSLVCWRSWRVCSPNRLSHPSFGVVFLSARPRLSEPKFYYNIPPTNLSIGNFNKNEIIISPIIVQYYPLTFGSFCDRILVSRGSKRPPPQRLENEPPSGEENSQKKLEKPLDKQHKMCYNEYVRWGTPTEKATKDCGNRHDAN